MLSLFQHSPNITMKFSLAVVLALAGPTEAFAPVKRAHGGSSSLQMVGLRKTRRMGAINRQCVLYVSWLEAPLARVVIDSALNIAMQMMVDSSFSGLIRRRGDSS